MKNKQWTNMCTNIFRGCKHNDCDCYMDYLLWTKDTLKLDFEQWKELIKIEMES